MKEPEILLAKTPKDHKNPRFEETLLGHTKNVCLMAELLCEKLTDNIFDLIGCDNSIKEYFSDSVFLGAWIHDWGKANNHFQNMIHGKTHEQGIRHETLSLLMVHDNQDWFKQIWDRLPKWAMCASLFSVTGHHLKFPDPFSDRRSGIKITTFLGHKDFIEMLDLGRLKFRISQIPELDNREYSLLASGDAKKILRKLKKYLNIDFNEVELRLISSVKSMVFAADIAGSALQPNVKDPIKWVEERLLRRLRTGELDEVVNDKLKQKKLYSFQEDAKTGEDKTTLLEAGCGAGKTVAAYLWASKRANNKRLFFCYPTMATSSEGFKGYMREPDFDAILIHSKSKMDYLLLDNMPSIKHEENDLRYSKLEALETWPVPVVVCTVHTVLGILENVRRGLFSWPSLVQSVFVFDEIHYYSERLFSYFLKFLETFTGADVFLMTATMPPKRREALVKICEKRGGLKILKGQAEREESKRYLVTCADYKEAWEKIIKAINDGDKVLWVSNTVNRAIEIAKRVSEYNIKVFPYHSRYKYRDRLQRQKEMIEAFSSGNEGVLAVTTQVAEISLDISADLLISEEAPIPSMIQRMGRLNRFEEKPKKIREAVFIEPPCKEPYTLIDKSEEEKLWYSIKKWLSILDDKLPKSQMEISDVFVEIAKKETGDIEYVKYCEWLNGLWKTRKDVNAIEEAGYTIEVINEEDEGKGELGEYAIPMPIPKHDVWREWKNQGRYLIAPKGTIIYDEVRGGRWKKK